MLKININKLDILNSKLYDLLNNYEKIYNVFFHEINNNKSYWHDSHANSFFSNIEKDKQENIVFFEEFKSICDIYNYIVREYQNIGDKVEFNLDNRDVLISKLNNFINCMDDVINKYKDFDNLFFLEESKYLMNEKDNYVKLKKLLLDIKQSNNKLLNRIEEIERQVILKCGKINIKNIKANSINIGTLGNTDENYIDLDKLEISIKKLKYYIKEEEIIYDSIKEIFENINYNYNTDNKSYLDELLTSFVHKFSVIINNHKNNITVLNNNIEKYKTAFMKAAHIIEGE